MKLINGKAQIERELERGSDISIISIVDRLIELAHDWRASDVHIDPTGQCLRVRLRIDGVLQDTLELPLAIKTEMISRIKILAGLRTDEHQSAQDGRFRMILADSLPVDVRVSVAPTFYGENAALRLLSDRSEQFTLTTLGLSNRDQTKVRSAIKKPYGMILVTGPTGSGKTTTLYTLIKILNSKEVSIITVEDPIEYSIGGINQIQVNARTSLSFANGLRSILRQDPDIIMVGEVRDAETAALAVNTSLTGHLLLSTLHTNDAATTLPRLLDMNVEPYLVAATANAVIGQRLVRKICLDCRIKVKLSMAEKESLTKLKLGRRFPDHLWRGQGCSVCGGSGYRGRIGIYEVMTIDRRIRDAFLKKASADQIKHLAMAGGMTTMLDDGALKVAAGSTTIEEVLRVVHE